MRVRACFVALGRTLRAAYPRDREEASRDVITSAMAFVHVLRYLCATRLPAGHLRQAADEGSEGFGSGIPCTAGGSPSAGVSVGVPCAGRLGVSVGFPLRTAFELRHGRTVAAKRSRFPVRVSFHTRWKAPALVVMPW